jgi:hypothetical protein
VTTYLVHERRWLKTSEKVDIEIESCCVYGLVPIAVSGEYVKCSLRYSCPRVLGRHSWSISAAIQAVLDVDIDTQKSTRVIVH